MLNKAQKTRTHRRKKGRKKEWKIDRKKEKYTSAWIHTHVKCIIIIIICAVLYLWERVREGERERENSEKIHNCICLGSLAEQHF